MIVFPAIDLQGGRCVRLKQGRAESADVFHDDPAAQAAIFEAQGFRYLHVVDLDGAFAGRTANGAAIERIAGAISIPFQLGGGLRTLAAQEDWLARGASRIVLGTAALKTPEIAQEACRLFEGKVVIALDARGGKVAVEGWTEESGLEVKEAARRVEDWGAAAILHTDIARDGLMEGLNVESHVGLARAVSLPVIASGGVSGLEDLKALARSAEVGIEGVVAGRALYDGRLDAGQALSFVSGAG